MATTKVTNTRKERTKCESLGNRPEHRPEAGMSGEHPCIENRHGEENGEIRSGEQGGVKGFNFYI